METLPNHDEPSAGLGLFFPSLPSRVFEPSLRQPREVPQPDIARLTTRLARQDETAYCEFYDLYFNRLLRYLLVVTGGREDAARDALQAAMLRLVRHARKFDSEEAFWSWLTVLARSSLVDAERKRHRYLALLDRFFHLAQPPAPAANSEADGLFASLLEKNLETLSAEDRRLLESKYFDAQSVREIAADLGTTEKTIESRLTRVRRQLKASILAQLKDENEI